MAWPKRHLCISVSVRGWRQRGPWAGWLRQWWRRGRRRGRRWQGGWRGQRPAAAAATHPAAAPRMDLWGAGGVAPRLQTSIEPLPSHGPPRLDLSLCMWGLAQNLIPFSSADLHTFSSLASSSRSRGDDFFYPLPMPHALISLVTALVFQKEQKGLKSVNFYCIRVTHSQHGDLLWRKGMK